MDNSNGGIGAMDQGVAQGGQVNINGAINAATPIQVRNANGNDGIMAMDEGTNNTINADSANHDALAGSGATAVSIDGNGQAVTGANTGGAANNSGDGIAQNGASSQGAYTKGDGNSQTGSGNQAISFSNTTTTIVPIVPDGGPPGLGYVGLDPVTG